MLRKTLAAFLDPTNAEDRHLLTAASVLALISFSIYATVARLT